MSHRDRSVRGMRSEAQRIYNQRRFIHKLSQEIQTLREENKRLQKYEKAVSKALDMLVDNVYADGFNITASATFDKVLSILMME